MNKEVLIASLQTYRNSLQKYGKTLANIDTRAHTETTVALPEGKSRIETVEENEIIKIALTTELSMFDEKTISFLETCFDKENRMFPWAIQSIRRIAKKEETIKTESFYHSKNMIGSITHNLGSSNNEWYYQADYFDPIYIGEKEIIAFPYSKYHHQYDLTQGMYPKEKEKAFMLEQEIEKKVKNLHL